MNNRAISSGEPIEISAIVSAYNSERFMRGCLKDLTDQTAYRQGQVEIIVVDSGSPQKEGAMVKEFQERFPNIRYLRTAQREGVYAAWNRGIQVARGQYLTNANCDDRHKQDAFERMVSVLEMRPEVALVYADVIKTATENETFERCTEVGRYHWHDWDRQVLLTRGCFIGPQPMWRRKVHDRYGYFDETLVTSGDYEFWLRISQSFDFYHIRMPLGLYLVRPDSIEHRNGELRRTEDARIQKLYRRAANRSQIIRRAPFNQLEKPDIEARGRTQEKAEGWNRAPHDQIYEARQPSMQSCGGLPFYPFDEEKASDRRMRALDSNSHDAQANLQMLTQISAGAEPARSAEELYAAALRQSADGDARAALRSLEQLVGRHPDFARAHNDIGVLSYQMGDQRKALTHYEKAAGLEPWNLTFQKNLADCCWVGFGRLEDAMKIYVDILAAHPQDLEALLALGKACDALGQFKDAEAFFQRALEIDPRNTDVQNRLAHTRQVRISS